MVSISICILVNIYALRCGRRLFYTDFVILCDGKVGAWEVLYSMLWRHGDNIVYSEVLHNVGAPAPQKLAKLSNEAMFSSFYLSLCHLTV